LAEKDGSRWQPSGKKRRKSGINLFSIIIARPFHVRICRAIEEYERQMREEEEKKRRPSRFEVTPAPDILKLKTQSTNELMPPGDGVRIKLNSVKQ